MAGQADLSLPEAEHGHARTKLASAFTDILWQSIERLRPWMAAYVKSHLDWSASENDFTDRIVHRLAVPPTSDLPDKRADSASTDELVRTTLKFLVHEDKRASLRRQHAQVQFDERVMDPNSLALHTSCETELMAREVLSRIPSDLLPIVKSLYGLHGQTEMTVRAIARECGIAESTLRQKLCRLRAKLRKELGARL
jgi:DNA-directed RNA polymerase specialized sigma24 family protein